MGRFPSAGFPLKRRAAGTAATVIIAVTRHSIVGAVIIIAIPVPIPVPIVSDLLPGPPGHRTVGAVVSIRVPLRTGRHIVVVMPPVMVVIVVVVGPLLRRHRCERNTRRRLPRHCHQAWRTRPSCHHRLLRPQASCHRRHLLSCSGRGGGGHARRMWHTYLRPLLICRRRCGATAIALATAAAARLLKPLDQLGLPSQRRQAARSQQLP